MLLARVCCRLFVWVKKLEDTVRSYLTLMRREPPAHQRRVTLADVHVDCVVKAFVVSVNSVFSIESLSFLKWVIWGKPDGIDGGRFVLAVSQQELDNQFVCGFR